MFFSLSQDIFLLVILCQTVNKLINNWKINIYVSTKNKNLIKLIIIFIL